MLSDIEIAQQAEMKPIVEIAKGCQLSEDELELKRKFPLMRWNVYNINRMENLC